MKKHIENTIENPITANSVRDNNDDNIIDAGVCYWVTGHSMGAKIKGTEIIIFKAIINFAKNDELLTIIITVPFIF